MNALQGKMRWASCSYVGVLVDWRIDFWCHFHVDIRWMKVANMDILGVCLCVCVLDYNYASQYCFLCVGFNLLKRIRLKRGT